jgi:hypothetical protein
LNVPVQVYRVSRGPALGKECVVPVRDREHRLDRPAGAIPSRVNEHRIPGRQFLQPVEHP